MIIAFTGKKGSGKSLACQILKDKGYEELNFADPLKHMAVELAPEIPLADCYDLEAKERFRDIVVSVDAVSNLLRKYDIPALPIAFLSDDNTQYEFPSLRKFLQWVGAEAFRSTNVNFWVDILVSKVKPGVNYVIGDTRYANEVEAINRLGGATVMINRPSTNIIKDTHSSEQFDFTADYSLLNNDLETFKSDIVNVEALIRKYGTIKR